MTGLAGRVALITGAATGLGFSQARTLAAAGAKVALVDLGERTASVEPGYPLAGDDQLRQAAESIPRTGADVTWFAANVHDQSQLDAAVSGTVEAFGRLDVVVATAGVAVVGPAIETSRSEWDLVMTTNLTGAWQACKAAVPTMIRQRSGGRIVLISSAAGFKPMAGLAAYSASKAGVIALAKCLALELAEHRITVNAICPSTVPSGTNRGLASRLGMEWETLVDGWLEAQAIKELATPEDISAAVAFLASDDARLITGVALPVDAGTSVK
jgi:(+)-trans-carveol dehydrogenase